MRGDLPHTEGLTRDAANAIPSQDAAAFEALLDGLPLEEHRAQAPGDGYILKDASLSFIRKATISSPTLWQSLHVSRISSSKRQAVWKRALAKWNARAEPYPCCRTLR